MGFTPLCPFRLAAGEEFARCDQTCAWFLGNGRCAVAQIALILTERRKEISQEQLRNYS